MPTIDRTKIAPVKPKKGGKKPAPFTPPEPDPRGAVAAELGKERAVLYPTLVVNGQEVPEADTVLNAQQLKDIFDWETEEEFVARKVKEVSGGQGLDKADAAALAATFAYGDDYLLKDHHKNKVNAWNNARNRPFDEGTALRYAQDILNREWRLNGETIIVGKSGLVLSGQHRAAGLILASEMWKAGKRGKWDSEPTLSALVVFGVDEDRETLRTLDNVRPRTESDVIYTSGLFDDLGQSERKEVSRMMARAVDLLWKRTGAATHNTAEKFQTHSASMGFVERHPRLAQCVRHLFGENKERAISFLQLSAGHCAALLYCMGSCSSDGDDYRNQDPPSEAALAWDEWDRALAFWKDLLTKNTPLNKALHNVKKPAEGETEAGGYSTFVFTKKAGTGGTAQERLATVVKAWNAYCTGNPRAITTEDLTLAYDCDYTNDDHTLSTYEMQDFPKVEGPMGEGIDLGPGKELKDDESSAVDGVEAVDDAGPTDEERVEELERRTKEAASNRKRPTARIKPTAADDPDGVPATAPGEVRGVKKPAKGADGKPPAPTLLKKPLNQRDPKDPLLNGGTAPKPQTRTTVQQAQTDKARQADEELAQERTAAGLTKPALPVGPAPAKRPAKKPAK